MTVTHAGSRPSLALTGEPLAVVAVMGSRTQARVQAYDDLCRLALGLDLGSAAIIAIWASPSELAVIGRAEAELPATVTVDAVSAAALRDGGGAGSVSIAGHPVRAWAGFAARDETPAGLLAVLDRPNRSTPARPGIEAAQLAILARQAQDQVAHDVLAAADARRRAETSRILHIAGVGGLAVDLRAGYRNLRSPEYLAIHGLGPESADESHADWVRRIHPDEREPVERRFIEAVRGGDRRYEAEYRIIRPSDGEVRWINATAEIERDVLGKATRLVGAHRDVTERKQAEIALRESEERFRLVAERAPVMIWMSDVGGDCVYVNALLRAFWGDAGETVAPFDGGAAIHPDDRARVAAAVAAALGRHAPFTVEARHRRHDGVYRTLTTDAQPRFDEEGGFLGMIGVNVDVSDAREAERKLVEESRALAVLNHTGAAIAAELDLEQLVQKVTDGGREITGAAFGAFFYNVANADGESYMLYTLSGAARSDFSSFPMPRATAIFAPTFNGEAVVRSNDVTTDPRYGLSAPYWGMPAGHLPLRSYLAVPVTSRAGDVIGGLFFGHPDAGVFTERAERLVIGLAAQAAIAFDNAHLLRAANREVAQRRQAEAALQALNNTLEQQVAARTREVSERDEALRQAQKMEVVGQLTGGVAHDFNNLLQVVVGNLELLQRHIAADQGRLRRAADNAMDGARRAAVLTQRLLAFSRRQPLDPRPVDANRLILDMSDLLQRTLGETIAVNTALAPDLWWTEVDANQLENAVLNLAVNARDAMPAGGSLLLETRNVRLAPADIAAHAEIAPGDYVRLRVSDTGVGMDPDTAARVFEPFFTTKEPGKGTGLGLSMVYGFVRQSGGGVAIESARGAGASVTIHLPRLAGATARAEAPASQLAPRAPAGETILVLEDDADVRAYSAEALRDLGYRVIEAGDGPAALRLLAAGDAVDVLFTDVVLPGGMDGAEVARVALSIRPGLKVLFTSGYARDAIVHRGRLDPGVTLLTKPFTYAALAVKMREILS